MDILCQEQQQKQLDLILAIAKGAKLWEANSVKSRGENPTKTSKSSPDGVASSKMKTPELQTKLNDE